MLLHTAYDRSSHLSGNERIFGVVLKGTSAERVAVDVHAGGEPYGYTEGFHFFPDCISDLFQQRRIKALRQQLAARPGGRILIVNDAVLRVSHLALQCHAGKTEEIALVGFEVFRDTGGFGAAVRKLNYLTGQVQSGRAVRKDHVRDTERLIKVRCGRAGSAHGFYLQILIGSSASHRETDQLIRAHTVGQGIGIFRLLIMMDLRFRNGTIQCKTDKSGCFRVFPLRRGDLFDLMLRRTDIHTLFQDLLFAERKHCTGIFPKGKDIVSSAQHPCGF